MTVGPCRLLDSNNNWPSFFKCDDTTRFPPMCKVRLLYFYKCTVILLRYLLKAPSERNGIN
jgi:hypothetical protein